MVSESPWDTWSAVDDALDDVEAGDGPAIAAIYEAHHGKPVRMNGRRSRVNLTNFSKHAGIPRHQLESWVRDLRETRQEAS